MSHKKPETEVHMLFVIQDKNRLINGKGGVTPLQIIERWEMSQEKT